MMNSIDLTKLNLKTQPDNIVNAEKITVHQLWKRYVNVHKRSQYFRNKWESHVNKLHDIEYRIEMVRGAIRNIYDKHPDKQKLSEYLSKKLKFLRRELSDLKEQRNDVNYCIPEYKKLCRNATTLANRYLMAYQRIRFIASNRAPMGLNLMERGQFISDFVCRVYVYNSGGINVIVKGDDTHDEIEFHF